MSWWTALPTALATLVTFWGPGLAFLGVLGLRGLRLAALAPAVGGGILGLAAVVAAAAGVPWGPWTAVLASTVATIVGASVHRVARRGAAPTAPASAATSAGAPAARHLLIVLGLALAAQLVPVAVAMGRPDRVQNAWDALFHLRAVVAARESHRADPTWVAQLLEPSGGAGLYPSGWHAVAVLVPAPDPRVAVTVAAVLPCVLAITLGVTLLAREIWQAPLPTVLAPMLLAGGIAGPLAIALQPGLIPNAFALSLVPAVLSVVVRWSRTGARLTTAETAGTGLGLLGIGLSHPGAALGLAVLAAPWAGAAALRVAAPHWRAGRRALVVTVGAAGAAVLGLGAASTLASPTGRSLAAIDEDPGVPAGELLADVALGDLGEWPSYPLLPTLLALALAVGVTLGRRPARRDVRLLTVALGLSLVLYLAAASGLPALSSVTDLWYSEPRRIAPLVGICVTLLAAGALSAIARAAVRRITLPESLSSDGAASLIALVVVGLTVVPGVHSLTGLAHDTFSQDVPAQPRLFDRVPYLSAAEESMIERLRGTLDPDALLLGSSFSGPGHLAALTGQTVVQPYHAWVLDDATVYVSGHLADIGTDPRVCAEVRSLGARYVWVDPYPLHSTYWTFAAMGAFTHHPTGLAPLDVAGSTAVYDLDLCY